MIIKMIRKPLHKLMEKEVNRKEFLLYSGFLLAAVTGAAGVWKNVSGVVNGNGIGNQATTQKGFGGGSYGA
jgi:hypothetical protein